MVVFKSASILKNSFFFWNSVYSLCLFDYISSNLHKYRVDEVSLQHKGAERVENPKGKQASPFFKVALRVKPEAHLNHIVFNDQSSHF